MHTHNYEDFVKFIGNDLEDVLLSKYLSIAKSHKNVTYVNPNTVKQFVNVIGNWMREKSLQTKSCDYLTLMLDESTDESNRSELCLIFRIVNNGVRENYFFRVASSGT